MVTSGFSCESLWPPRRNCLPRGGVYLYQLRPPFDFSKPDAHVLEVQYGQLRFRDNSNIRIEMYFKGQFYIIIHIYVYCIHINTIDYDILYMI